MPWQATPKKSLVLSKSGRGWSERASPAVIMKCDAGRGLSAAAWVARSSAQLTVRPLRTVAAASAVRSAVRRLRAPRWSSSPQRPQFFTRSNVVSNHARSRTIGDAPRRRMPRTLCCSRVTAGRALVIGGTGPTGIPIVAGLVERGFGVTILHRGTHERPETPDVVEHRHADPFDEASLADGL